MSTLPRRAARRRTLLALVVLSTLACDAGRRDDTRADASAADTTAAAAPARPVRVTPEEFASLRWLVGSWRGTMPQGGAFYERYRFADDSTIAMRAFADSTFTRATDSSRTMLRDGIVAHESGGARWEATRLDSVAVEFAPVRRASNRFTWTNNGPDAWTATLADGAGAPTAIYPMERVGR